MEQKQPLMEQEQPLPFYSFQNLKLNRARQHSHRVRLMRILFITLSVLILFSLILAFILYGKESVFLPSAPKVLSTKMINPRFSGRDSSGRPFIVTATEAVQIPGSENVFELLSPKLQFNLKEGSSSYVQGRKGLYDRVANVLELYDEVSFDTDAGYSFLTQKARFLVNENRIEGDLPVTGDGPRGKISAKGFTIEDNWNRYTFKGKVKTVLKNEKNPRESILKKSPEKAVQ